MPATPAWGNQLRIKGCERGNRLDAPDGGHPRLVSAWIPAHNWGLMGPLLQALTMTVEAKIEAITGWSLSDRTNRKGDF
jgi:hypothetical protein